jgi:hypothetical protein
MEKYYDSLVEAEHVCEYFPVVTKIIVRKIIEIFLKNVAQKNGIENNVAIWNLIDNIKLSSSFSLPTEMYDSIEVILINGYKHVSRIRRKKFISKNSIEILEMIHNILCWYFRTTEPQVMLLFKDLDFHVPRTIEDQRKEVDKIKQDILLKDNQINNLRQKLIEIGTQSRSVIGLNKIIMAIKEEKSDLETVELLLKKKIEIQERQVIETEKKYKAYIKKLEQLEESCKESQQLIFNKESQLVNIEMQKQELKILIKEQDEQDEAIIRIEKTLEEELKRIRKVYEELVRLLDQYQDMLETIEFSYDKELQKILEAKIHNITMQISFDDRIFNENINIYTKNIGEAKRKISIFKEILNEDIKRKIKYQQFYIGFLRLQGRELRIIYTIINSITTSSNLISKSRELLSMCSEDKFIDTVNKNLKELKDISDDEIKLILYYKLIKLSQINLGKIYNRKKFIDGLDSIVDKAYKILIDRKDFKGRIRKIDAIGAYYLEKIVLRIKNKSSNLQINDELVDRIYRKIIELKQNADNVGAETIYYENFNLETVSEITVKSYIKSQVFTSLLVMIELGAISSYKDIVTIIFEVKKLTLKTYTEEASINKFSNEYFIIYLFLSSGAISLNRKREEELVPLLVTSILSISLTLESGEYDDYLESYNNMVVLWKKKQQKYNDIFIEKEDMENQLETLVKEKSELEANYENLVTSYNIFFSQYNNYEEEFKNIVINSEKVILLPSYMEYDKLRNKKEVAESSINDAKNKFGTLKSILSPDVWKDQASKLISETNMIELEEALIEEAKQKLYFKKEYKIFDELNKKIENTKALMNKEEEKLKDKNLLIHKVTVKINEVQSQLNKVKDTYLDMEEGYY